MEKLREAIMGIMGTNLDDIEGMQGMITDLTIILNIESNFRVYPHQWYRITEFIDLEVLQQDIRVQVNYSVAQLGCLRKLQQNEVVISVVQRTQLNLYMPETKSHGQHINMRQGIPSTKRRMKDQSAPHARKQVSKMFQKSQHGCIKWAL